MPKKATSHYQDIDWNYKMTPEDEAFVANVWYLLGPPIER